MGGGGGGGGVQAVVTSDADDAVLQTLHVGARPQSRRPQPHRRIHHQLPVVRHPGARHHLAVSCKCPRSRTDVRRIT